MATTLPLSVFAQPGGGGGGCAGGGTNLSCNNTISDSNANGTCLGDDPTASNSGCNPCCYAGSDLDGDGDQDVSFSVENTNWYEYCNNTGGTFTVEFVVDAPGCNLQGAVWNMTQTGGATDCGHSSFNSHDSSPGGSGGFSLSITLADGECGGLMVDGYAGFECGSYTVTAVCPSCSVVADAGLDVGMCPGGSVTIGGDPVGPENFDYSWSSGAGSGNIDLTGGGQDNGQVVVSPNSTTTYTLTVSDPNDPTCSVTDQVVVTVGTPAPDAGANQTVCSGQTVTIGGDPVGNNGDDYQWSSGDNGQIKLNGNPNQLDNGQVDVTPLVTTTYTVTTTDANGCTGTAEVTITVDFPTANAGVDVTICDGGSALIGNDPVGAHGDDYAWSTGASGTLDLQGGGQDHGQITASPNNTTTYTVTVTDTNGCTATDEVTVTVGTSPTADAGADMLLDCVSGTATLDGSGSTSGGGTTYNWAGPNIVSGGATTSPVVDAAGTYTITVTNSAGCTATDEVVVTDNTPPTANAGADMQLDCVPNTVMLDGSGSTSGGGTTYNWVGPNIVSGGATTSPVVDAAGTYTITVTNSAGCTATDEAVVTDPVPPTADAGASMELSCQNTSVILDGTASSSGPNIDYSWSGPGIVSGGTTDSPTVGQAGLYTLTVTDTDTGCTATATVLVTELVVSGVDFSRE